MFLKMKQYITENTGILIHIDDIAENMNWEAMRKPRPCLISILSNQ